MIGIDSSVLIDILRNKETAAKIHDYADEDFCTSEIVIYEILYGIYASRTGNERKLKEFMAVLDTFTHIFPVNRKVSLRAAQIAGKLSREGKTISHTDTLIAGSLLVNGCTKFMTANIKDFERIKELELIR